MKKYLVLIILLLVSCSVNILADDELKDNRLQIDSSRLEEKKSTDANASSDLIKDLFSTGDRIRLEKNKEMATEQFKQQQSQLFTQKMKTTTVSPVDSLFSSEVAVGQYTSKVDASVDSRNQTISASFLAIFYGLASLLLICGASVVTYLVSRGENSG